MIIFHIQIILSYLSDANKNAAYSFWLYLVLNSLNGKFMIFQEIFIHE